MASLQERNGSYRVQFFFRGKLHGFTIGKVTATEAQAKAAQVEYLLMRLKHNTVARVISDYPVPISDSGIGNVTMTPAKFACS